MDKHQTAFEALATLFEGYVDNLAACQSPQERAWLLTGMAILIKEIDRLVEEAYLSLATTTPKSQTSPNGREKPTGLPAEATS